MRYFDKRGDEIDETLWAKHIRNPKYTDVRRSFFGPVAIETSWLGVQTKLCPRPSLFVTIVKFSDDREADECVWYEQSLDKVRKLHLEMCVRLGIPTPENPHVGKTA